jgi:hypothetical protein
MYVYRTVGRQATRIGMLLALLTTLLVIPARAEEAPALHQEPTPQHVHERDQGGLVSGATYRVYAYREGLVGHTTANGHVIQPNDYFVALPCFCALSSRGGNEFQVKVEYNGKSLILPVWDVGPWNVSDNYWDPPHLRQWQGLPQGRPMAAAAFYDGYNGGNDGWGRKVGSPGGMDIGDGAFWELGMKGSDWVNVTFLWLEPDRWELPPLPRGYEDIPTVWWDERPPFDRVPARNDGRHGYVPETGHNIPNVLYQHWHRAGGWQTFGLPISEFFREVNRDGTIRYVQYFERQILAVDLSGRTNPPQVLGDLLGHRTYIDPVAKQTVEPFAWTETSWYFGETGHSLQNGFKAYWLANGGLMTFGFPLSEEWSEIQNGRKVVIQVFERARFEWWPDRVGTGEEITRGLLTVELMERAGLYTRE